MNEQKGSAGSAVGDSRHRAWLASGNHRKHALSVLAAASILALLSGCTGPARAATPVPAPNSSTTLAAPSAAASTPSHETLIHTAFLTAYTWFDNTPPGSAIISNPVLHRTAGGTGTYADPVTVAVGHSTATGRDVLDIAAGTRIYVPDVRRYFIVEDTCGDGPTPQNEPCHKGNNVERSGSTLWIDLWIGGRSGTITTTRQCASRITGTTDTAQTIVLNPAPDYVVAPGAGVFHNGTCDAGYGQTPTTQ